MAYINGGKKKMRRRRCLVSADEWRLRLDECMARVLSAPATFPEVTVLWARWRMQWLASQPAAPTQPARPRGAEQYSLLAPLDEQK